MGKFTKNFKQTKQARQGNQSAQSYAKIQRFGSWYRRVKDFVSVRGKQKPDA